MVFGNKKRAREAQERARETQAAYEAKVAADVALTKTITEESFETGLNGSAEAFSQAWAKDADSDTLARRKLREGAVQAFLQEGRPENVQMMLVDRDKHDFKVSGLLLHLTKGRNSEQAVAIISLALDKLPVRKKQEMLDDALLNHITSVSQYGRSYKTFDKNDEAFTEVLLQAGADANGHEGLTFAYAIAYHSPATVKLLRASGAKYEDALLIMEINGWEGPYSSVKGSTKKLRAYQERENGSTMEQLQQNVSDLTERLKVAEARLDELQPERKTSALSPKKLRLNTPSQP